MRILILLLFSVTMYGQTLDRNKVIVRESLRFGGTNPAPNKILRSIDLMGNLEYIYLTDLQDSLNTGIYDTIDANVVQTNSVRIRAPFTNQILSLGSDSTVAGCGVTCDDIRWTTIDDTQTVLKDSTDKVGIGTSSPTANLDVRGSILIKDSLSTGNFFAKTSEEFYQISVDPVSGISFVGTDAANLDTVFNGTYYDSNSGSIFGGISAKRDSIDAYIRVFPIGVINLSTLNNNSSDGANISINTSEIAITATDVITLNSDELVVNIPSAATGYVLTALDADGNATWQDKTAYGEMGFGDSLRTIAITQNVFSVVTNSANNLWSAAAVDLHNVTYSGDSLIIDSAGVYQINVQLSMDGTNGSVIRLGVFLNGVLTCSCTGYEELSSNRVIQLNYINIDQLNAGDVLQVVVTNTASNDDVDVVAGKITINKIR